MRLCQANELELALDVYGQLLREGCTPNLVTYNILIDIHGKMGNWQEAVQVLDALEDQVRHANTPIRPPSLPSICHGGSPVKAFRVQCLHSWTGLNGIAFTSTPEGAL